MHSSAYYNSPIGNIEIKGSILGVSSVRIIDSKVEEKTPPHFLRKCITQLHEYFEGNRTEFDLRLDWSEATFFNQTVWRELIQIPYGQTMTYSSIAKNIGKPNAARAVGLANRNNPIAIIVPCHRVIGKSGNLIGYFYGLDTKRQLLKLENPLSYAEQGKLF